MISFVSLLLGLVVGIRTVEVQVGEPVAAVEFRLDGQALATLTGEPWSLAVDFGTELEPHHLVAVARDAAGRELDRAEQWINLPRPPAEARLFVEREGGGWIARLSWESVVGSDPRAVHLELDGAPLEVGDPRRIELPPVDAKQLHFLRAELAFSDEVSSSAEVTFGGQYSDSLRTDLTAVPVIVEHGEEVPEVRALQGWLLHGEEPLNVVAVEEGAADIVLVPGPGVDEAVQRMALRPGAARAFPRAGGARYAMTLKKDQRLRFLIPYAESRRGVRQGFDVFPSTPELTPRDGGLFWQLTGLRPTGGVEPRLRMADAVAVAALVAAERNRRRAVVLFLGHDQADEGRHDAARVRRYLARLRVPLVVWSLGEAPAGDWGEAAEVESLLQLERRVRTLARWVDRQRIVWVEGTWLPQEISLSPQAAGLRLATEAPAEGDEDFPQVETPPAPSLRSLVDRLFGEAPAGVASVFDVGRTAAAPAATGRAEGVDPGHRRQRLEQARQLLGEEVGSLGPWALLTDVDDLELLEELGRRAAALVEDYRQRYAVAVPPPTLPEVALLFAHEREYRLYERGEAAVADLGLAGHGGGGLAALYAEQRPPEEVGALLIHELTHLLNRRAFGGNLPPWLDEGLANDLGFARAGGDGHLSPGTLWGRDAVHEQRLPLQPGQLRLEQTRVISGALAALSTLAEALGEGRLLPLETLVSLSQRQLVAAEERSVRYPESAFFVRFLLDDEEERAGRFRTFLAAVAAGAPSDGEALTASLATTWPRLQRDFETWLRQLARRQLGP